MISNTEKNSEVKAKTKALLEKKMQRNAAQREAIRNKLEAQIHPNTQEEKLPELPYADYASVRNVKSLNHRFLLADGHEPSATEKGFTIPDDYIAPLVFAPWAAGQYSTIQMKKNGISSERASEQSGIDSSLFSRYQNYNRPFTPEPGNLSCFCQNVLHESCHKVMFGEEGKIILPHVYSAIFSELDRIPGRIMNNILAIARKADQEYEAEYPTELPNGPRRSQADMVRERMEDLAVDLGRPCMNIFKKDGDKQEVMNKRLYAILFSIFTDNKEKRSESTLSTLMYFAFESEYALDYFVSENFAKYCPIYIWKGSKTVQVTDPRVLEIIGIAFKIDKKRRVELLSDIMAETF